MEAGVACLLVAQPAASTKRNVETNKRRRSIRRLIEGAWSVAVVKPIRRLPRGAQIAHPLMLPQWSDGRNSTRRIKPRQIYRTLEILADGLHSVDTWNVFLETQTRVVRIDDRREVYRR